MSVQFGKCNFDGKPVDPKDIDDVRPVLAPYGPDGEGYLCKDNLGILYRAFHTTKESQTETQPNCSKAGSLITWDGRLDNRQELTGRLAGELSRESTDLEIVAAAWERWGTNAFGKLIGDWALSIWNPQDQSLILAKDFAGIRHLYYSVEKDQVTWCTVLEPLVLFASRSLELEEEYLAGWLAFFPAPHLTPYAGIHSVPPSSFVLLQQRTQRVSKYWDFDPGSRVRHRTDAEYEEHFRAVFSESVRRRLRSDSPVLAELSGGMDSSSIVCMADDILARKSAVTPRMDTLSYYDDSEPNWNERPYFDRVIEKRGQPGCCIDLGSVPFSPFSVAWDKPSVIPHYSSLPSAVTAQVRHWMTEHRNRVVLSGVGGDELLGGVPTPLPELADLLARGDIRELATKLSAWALAKRRPVLLLLSDAIKMFLPLQSATADTHWQCGLTKQASRRFGAALEGYSRRLRILGTLPSFQENLSALDSLRRQIAMAVPSSELSCEKSYPYLDREMVEFLFAVPRDQLVRPNQRRSLMRRALGSVVPNEILSRKRKAFVTRRCFSGILAEWEVVECLSQDMQLAKLGFIDPVRFREALKELKRGTAVPVVLLIRILALEHWLRQSSQLAGSRGNPVGHGVGSQANPDLLGQEQYNMKGG
jgi:asparagine synthase (glutamine-hydrolysing)